MQASLADWMEQKRTARSELLPVPLLPFWPWAPTRFYVAPGLVLQVSDEGGDNGSAPGPEPATAVFSPPWPTSRSSGTDSTADIASRVVGFAAGHR